MEWLIVIGIGFLVFRWWAKRQKNSRQAPPPQTYPLKTVDISSSSPPSSAKSLEGFKANVRSADARWLTKDQSVTVAGTLISKGFLYVGTSLPTQGGSSNENCLINSNPPVASPPGDFHGATLPYWPSYQTISPVARRAYIDWLATERNDPQTYIGFVFLYFYGLERRLLIDNSGNEAPLLYAEVVRLLSVYGENGSFRRYATALLEAIQLKAGLPVSKPELLPERSSWEIPFGLRVAIGGMLARGETVDADWSLAWYLAHPETRLRTAARRCFPELIELFRARFAKEFPNGLNVEIPRRRLPTFNYRAASGTFSIAIKGQFESWPDVISLTAPLKGIGALVESCTSDLDSYSRARARSNASDQLLETAALLPQELVGTAAAAPLRALENWLNSQITGAVGFVSLQRLQEQISSTASTSALNKRYISGLSGILAKIGFGMEPDPRFGGTLPEADAAIVLFRAPQGALLEAVSSQYLLARLHAELGVLVANAEGTIGPNETSRLAQELKQNFTLPQTEQVRVLGYLLYLTKCPPNLRMLTKLKSRPVEIRHDCALLAIAIAGADGRVSTEEMRLLERIYLALELPTQSLYTDLNGFGVEEPIARVSAGDHPSGIPIPPPPSETNTSTGTVVLDVTRLAKVRSDTTRVAAVLDAVFAPDQDDQIVVDAGQDSHHPSEPNDVSCGQPLGEEFSGLDARHAELLSALKDADTISRSSFNALARERSLLPDGAIETINEWALNRYGEPLLDDGDPIEIAHHLFIAPTPSKEASLQS